MDRKREYQELLSELDSAPDIVSPALSTAKRRLRRRAAFTRPALSLACMLVCFIALVNFSAPAAQAFSRIPGLRELAAAVSFSRSLGDAVENEYVQQIDLQQESGGITAKVEYLIVDLKQVTVFFRLESEEHDSLSADADFRLADGSHIGSCTFQLNEFEVPSGELRSATLDIIDGELPGTLRMKLLVEPTRSGYGQQVDERWDPHLSDFEYAEPDYLAEFDFLLEFDPEFTETGKILEINQTVSLDSQDIIIESVEIYPSHLRLNVRGAEDNSAWLKKLSFYIEADSGERFDSAKNGVIATGNTGTPEMISYRADSTYFHTAKHLKLFITGAEWLDKDMETVRVDLAAGTADPMPENAELALCEKRDNGYLLAVKAKMRSENSFHQIFLGTYLDPNGNEDYINSWSSTTSYGNLHEQSGYFYEVFGLRDYPYDEVWLTPCYSATWQAETPIEMTLK